MLKAKRPETIEKRPKIFMYGQAGSGKTRAALQFARNYHIDCERGADNYVDLYQKSNSVRLQTTDYEIVIEQLKALATEKHDFQTVTIDPITTIESDLIAKAEDEYGGSDMRIWRDRDRLLKRLGNLLLNLDMNVIMIAHGKTNYGANMTNMGTTYDAWKRWVFTWDLSLEIERRGTKTVAIVRKTRLEKFPDGEVFDFSYNTIRERFGAAIEREVKPVVLASKEQIETIKKLIEAVKIPEGTVDKWFLADGVDAWEDMQADRVAKAIEYVRAQLPKENT